MECLIHPSKADEHVLLERWNQPFKTAKDRRTPQSHENHINRAQQKRANPPLTLAPQTRPPRQHLIRRAQTAHHRLHRHLQPPQSVEYQCAAKLIRQGENYVTDATADCGYGVEEA